MNGAQSATLNDVLHLVERSIGKSEGSTSFSANLGISDFIEEFFVGITHDKNMGRMAAFLDQNSPNLEENPDFHKTLSLTVEESLNDFYTKTRLSQDDLVFPIFTNYKMVSLD